jgi:hypothetical protein
MRKSHILMITLVTISFGLLGYLGRDFPRALSLEGPVMTPAAVDESAPLKVLSTSQLSVSVDALIVSGRPSKIIELELTEGKIWRAILDRVYNHENGGISWVGHLAEESQSQVILSLLNGELRGNIWASEGIFQVEKIEGKYLVRKLQGREPTPKITKTRYRRTPFRSSVTPSMSTSPSP